MLLNAVSLFPCLLLLLVSPRDERNSHRPVRSVCQPGAIMETSGGLQGCNLSHHAKRSRRSSPYLLLPRSVCSSGVLIYEQCDADIAVQKQWDAVSGRTDILYVIVLIYIHVYIGFIYYTVLCNCLRHLRKYFTVLMNNIVFFTIFLHILDKTENISDFLCSV